MRLIVGGSNTEINLHGFIGRITSKLKPDLGESADAPAYKAFRRRVLDGLASHEPGWFFGAARPLRRMRLQYLLWRPFSETSSGLNNLTEEKVPSIRVRSCMEARIAIPLALRERIRSAISSCRPLTLPSAQLIEDAAAERSYR